ncbi:MAG: hypothetical protein KME11_00330 [Timaviella obliquedivisa GSE-PSE-MK23-08B]|nr:hypothetical protein [Timaviella obliquedivisa GSE-PSE-MK23-08B]
MANANSVTSSPTTPYSVSIWEAIAIFAGAIFLISVGVVGLGLKTLNNAFDPKRAEAIAQSLIAYKIPGGSEGTFGTNLGGAKVAVVASARKLPGLQSQVLPPPEIELFIARIPINEVTTEDAEEELNNEFFPGFSFSSQVEAAFKPITSRTENQAFCGVLTQVTIQEGSLVLSEQMPIPAVQYQVRVVKNAERNIAVLSAAGQNAKGNAAMVFRSLKCKP